MIPNHGLVSMHETKTLPTTLLFVPASRPDRFQKALDSGADAICIDLEDAVAVHEKVQARDALHGYLKTSHQHRENTWIRINAPETDDGRCDLAMLASLGGSFGIMVPKTERPAQLELVSHCLPDNPRLIALIESAAAFARLDAIAAVGNVSALMLGPADLADDLLCKPTWDAMLHARGMLVMAARRTRVGVIDGPHFNIADDDETEQASRRASELGFDGKAAIHPRQIKPILRGFQPDTQDVERARRILDIFETATIGAAQVDGQFADGPLVSLARRVLSRAAG